jgi:hypothetical protein
MIFGLVGIAALGMMMSSKSTTPRLTKKEWTKKMISYVTDDI